MAGTLETKVIWCEYYLFTLHGWWFFILFMLVLDGMYWHYFFICNFQIFHLICLLNLRICHSKLQILLIPICNRRKTIQDKCFPLFGTCKMRLQFELNSWIKEGNSKGGENDGRLLIGFYYSAVTGNRKQVLTGSSESCEHKCRWNTLSFKLQVLFES